MTKLKTPILSLGAHGTLGKSVTFQRRSGTDFAREMPIPTDQKTLAQMYQRWDYQDYIAQWHELTPAEKLVYRKAGSKLRMPAFAYFMSIKLEDLPDLAGRWHLDEIGGTTAYDSSKNTNHGTIYGTTPATGLIADCRYFDGIDDRISCGTDETLDLIDNFTIEAFIHPTALGITAVIFSKTAGWTALGYTLVIRSNERLQFITAQAAAFQITTTNSGIITKDEWQYIVMTKIGASVKLYRNLVDVTFTPGVHLDPTPAGRLAQIGRAGSTYHYKGYLDEIRLNSRVLTEADMNRHYERRYPL